MNRIVYKYLPLVRSVINDMPATQRVVEEMRERHEANNTAIYAQDQEFGKVMLYRSVGKDGQPDRVLEMVSDDENDTFVMTLFEPSEFNSSLGRMIEVRKELIHEIGEVLGVIPVTLKIEDCQRGNKDLRLRELATTQLVEALAEFTGSSMV